MDMKNISEKELEILMADGCTKNEAVSYLDKSHDGHMEAVIFDKPEEWLENYYKPEKREDASLSGEFYDEIDDITLQEAVKSYSGSVSIVNYENHDYLILYIQ